MKHLSSFSQRHCVHSTVLALGLTSFEESLMDVEDGGLGWGVGQISLPSFNIQLRAEGLWGSRPDRLSQRGEQYIVVRLKWRLTKSLRRHFVSA